MWQNGGFRAQEAVARQAEALGGETRARISGRRPKAYLRPQDHLGTLSWLRCVADQTGLTRPIELQRRFDPRCFYVGPDGREKSSCKWAPIVRLERRPSAAILALVDSQLPGSSAAFKDCLIGFWYGFWTLPDLLTIRSNLAAPHIKVLGVRGAGSPVPVVRDALNASHLRYLMGRGTTDSLALLSAYLMTAAVRKEDPAYVRHLAECVYRHFLALSLELFRRGIAHDLFSAFTTRLFPDVEVEGYSPFVDARIWSDDVGLFNVLPYAAFPGPPARDWGIRQEQMAKIALGEVHPKATLAFSLGWVPRAPGVVIEDDPQCVLTGANRLLGRIAIQKTLTRLFSRPAPWPVETGAVHS